MIILCSLCYYDTQTNDKAKKRINRLNKFPVGPFRTAWHPLAERPSIIYSAGISLSAPNHQTNN